MLKFRKIEQADRSVYLKMTADFYSSDAVLIHPSEENFKRTFDELMRSDVYAECHIFDLDGTTVGYALLAKTFSQEAGGIVIWVEEIYVLPEYRGRGIGKTYLSHLIDTRGNNVRRIRLEAEKENEGAIKLYRSLGFKWLDYGQMIIDFK